MTGFAAALLCESLRVLAVITVSVRRREGAVPYPSDTHVKEKAQQRHPSTLCASYLPLTDNQAPHTHTHVHTHSHPLAMLPIVFEKQYYISTVGSYYLRHDVTCTSLSAMLSAVPGCIGIARGSGVTLHLPSCMPENGVFRASA